uniref:Uncharacterized protein n=1 Tax=Anguilla anguilla TaxID=7936 RepID=A0A0E9RIR1_ANGAN
MSKTDSKGKGVESSLDTESYEHDCGFTCWCSEAMIFAEKCHGYLFSSTSSFVFSFCEHDKKCRIAGRMRYRVE